LRRIGVAKVNSPLGCNLLLINDDDDDFCGLCKAFRRPCTQQRDTCYIVQALERFSGEASEVATRLRQLCDRLEDTQFPNDVTQTERLIAEHDAAQRELKRDLDEVIEHGENLLVCFKMASNSVGDVMATKLLPASRVSQVMAVERLRYVMLMPLLTYSCIMV